MTFSFLGLWCSLGDPRSFWKTECFWRDWWTYWGKGWVCLFCFIFLFSLSFNDFLSKGWICSAVWIKCPPLHWWKTWRAGGGHHKWGKKILLMNSCVITTHCNWVPILNAKVSVSFEYSGYFLRFVSANWPKSPKMWPTGARCSQDFQHSFLWTLL